MAEVDVIIAKFQADISDYQAKLNQLEKEVRELSDTEKKGADNTKKNYNELASASQKRKAAIVSEQAELKKLQSGLKTAFTVPEIEKFNSAINKSKNNIATLKGEASGLGSITGGLKSQFAGLGAGIAAAFTVQAVIAFGKASIDAFLEAEENAARLKNSLREVGDAGNVAFERLIKQSERLARTGVTIYTDDDIQRAQTQLATFGLTADEIEKIIPKLADYASATKQNIVDASAKVGQALIGQGREFKKYGINVDAAKTTQENFNILLEGFGQFQGVAAKETQTLTGKLADQERVVGELQEELGSKLAPAYVSLKKDIISVGIAITNLFSDSTRLINLLDGLGVASNDASELIENGFKKVGRSKDELKKAAKDAVFLKNSLELIVSSADRLGVTSSDIGSDIVKLTKQMFEQNTTTNEGQVNINLYAKAIAELRKKYNELEAPLKSSIDLSKKSTEELLKLKEASGDDSDLLKLIDREIAARKKSDDAVKKSIELQKKLAEEKKKASDAEAVEKNRLAGVNKDINSTIQEDATKQVEKNTENLTKINQEYFDDHKKQVLADTEFELSEADRKEKERLDILEDSKEKQEKLNREIQDESIQAANDLVNALFDIQRNNLKRQQDAQLQALSDEKDIALSSKRLTESQKDKINKEFAAKEQALRKKQFLETQQQDISLAIMKAALAVVQTFATLGYPAGIPAAIAVAATLAAEIATIKSQKFAKGKRQNEKGGLSEVGEQGPEYMFVPDNAMILTAQKSRQHKAMIEAMMDNNLDSYLEQNYLIPRLTKFKNEFENRKEKSFSNNLAKSLIIQGLTGNEMERIRKRGTDINNVDELAQKIAEILTMKTNPRRRV